MANRLIFILCIFFIGHGCSAKEILNKQCNINLHQFLHNNGSWEVMRKPDEFSPIVGLKIYNTKLWVSTYGSDFFPAQLKSRHDAVIIENIRFRRRLPVKIDNDPAELVKSYKAKDVMFSIVLPTDNCETTDKLQIEITLGAENGKEILNFTKVKK